MELSYDGGGGNKRRIIRATLEFTTTLESKYCNKCGNLSNVLPKII